MLDAGLLVVWLGTFLIVPMVHPSIANLRIAWLGTIVLGWYKTLTRHDARTDELRAPRHLRLAGTAVTQDN
jgi:hypothetical protein